MTLSMFGRWDDSTLRSLTTIAHGARKPLVHATVIVAAIILIGFPRSAAAESGPASTSRYEIAAQPLNTALRDFALASGLQVSFPDDMAQGLTSPGVNGTYTPAEALAQLLAGTGLAYRFTSADTVTLQRTAAPAPPPPSGRAERDAPPADDTVPKLRDDRKPVKVPEVVIKEARYRDDEKTYVAEEANTATRTDTPIRDVPQSIQVITRKVIEEQRAFRLLEATQNISGINSFAPTTTVFDQFLIRGFVANPNNFFRNGLWDPLATVNASDTYNIQRLEVLKGPASVLYGQGDPGGIINVVTRKGLPDPYYAGNVTLGNFNFYRSELDATGPLNAGKTLMYRLNVAGQKANSFIDFMNRDLMAIAPSVTWLMSHRTTITVQADYLRRWYNNITGAAVPAQGSVLPNIHGPIPRNLFTSLGDLDKIHNTSYRIGYDLTHQFNNAWSLRNAYHYGILEFDQFGSFPLALLADQRTLTRFLGNQATSLTRQHQHNMVTNLVGHFHLLGMDHTLLSGVDLRQLRSNPRTLLNRTVPPLDIFAPNYDLQPGAVIGTFFSEADTKQVGLYVQDQIALLRNLKLLGGLRFDYLHQMGRTVSVTTPERTSDDTGVSPRVGIVYQPIEPVSLYASWMRGFLANDPTFSFNPDGTLFDPERSTQYEVGMKTFFLENRVSATLAWFHLTRENLLTPDPVNPLFRVQTGEQRSQGIELDVTASLTAGWNVIASYAYTDAEVTADNRAALLHKRLANVPYNKATLWSTYHFQEGPLKGFGFGGGVFGFTSRNASIFGPGQVEIPGYVRVDTALYYNRDLQPGNWLGAKAVNVALNVRNLLDHRYVELAHNTTTRFYFGEPRTVLATVGLQF